MNTVCERVFISFPFLDGGPNYLKILVVWGFELFMLWVSPITMSPLLCVKSWNILRSWLSNARIYRWTVVVENFFNPWSEVLDKSRRGLDPQTSRSSSSWLGRQSADAAWRVTAGIYTGTSPPPVIRIALLAECYEATYLLSSRARYAPPTAVVARNNTLVLSLTSSSSNNAHSCR